MAALLLILLGITVGTGSAMAVLINRWVRLNRSRKPLILDHGFAPFHFAAPRALYSRRPFCWLAVKGHNVLPVQTALCLHNPKPCSWMDGLAGQEKLFIG